MYRTVYHRNGEVTVWDVYQQQWVRTARPRDEVLASLSTDSRERVLRHCKLQDDGAQEHGEVLASRGAAA